MLRCALVRTTVTLDPDTEALVRKRMKERKVSFKQALNDCIREGAHARRSKATPFRTPTADLGEPTVSIERALRLAAELEDEALVRKVEVRK